MTSEHGPAEICLWVTPKIFDDIADPRPGLEAFFDHYRSWFPGRRVTLVICAGNGDHVLNYRGRHGLGDRFDWARYNSFAMEPGRTGNGTARSHNEDWLRRVRDGGERSANPYSAGPMFIVSEQEMDYGDLERIYRAARAVADERGVDVRLLEYLEPGPEFCRSTWKTERHPEVSAAAADAGGHVIPGVIDVTLPLVADQYEYVAFPGGIPGGLMAGTFVAAQTARFLTDFALDGVLLGNQFGLLGFWHPDNAPMLTAERREGIARFFTEMRRELGDKALYWMDTYWSADREREAWGMSETSYAAIDAIILSTFAVLVERTEIVPNLLSKSVLPPRILFAVDFVDPWYWYRTYLDDRRTYQYQREVLLRYRDVIEGVTFFANDTFGHFVPSGPLKETYAAAYDQGDGGEAVRLS